MTENELEEYTDKILNAKIGKSDGTLAGKYNNKWVLYKYNMLDSFYTSVFIKSIVDDIVSCVFEDDPDSVRYINISYFEGCYEFRLNPVQNPSPLKPKGTETSDEVKWGDDMHSFGNPNFRHDITHMKRNVKPCCEHFWDYTTLMCYPPIHQRRCRICGVTQRYHTPKCSMDTDFSNGMWEEYNE